MERLKSCQASLPQFRGVVEADEFYIKAGLKGRPYHEEIIKSGRQPRRRGLKPWRGRGTFDKDQPMIMCIHQRRRKGGMTYFDVPLKQSLISNIRNIVHYHSKIYTDEYLAYRKLNEYGFVHRHWIAHVFALNLA